jgi:hypothetical protein
MTPASTPTKAFKTLRETPATALIDADGALGTRSPGGGAFIITRPCILFYREYSRR